MSGKVLVVGSYNQDHTWRVNQFPTPGETLRGDDFATGAGGKGFNQAVAAVRQGADTVFIGVHGEDALGQLAERNARAAGLTCRWQVTLADATGSAAILVDASGQNQIIVSLGANLHLAPAFLATCSRDFEAATALLLQLESPLDAIRTALDMARQHDTLRILNPAPFDQGVDGDALAQCDILTPNETEFAGLLRHVAGVDVRADEVAGMADTDLHGLCRRLPATSIVITLGRHGCFVSHGSDGSRVRDAAPFYRIAAEKVQAIDTSGAGDAFNGTLAAALARWPDAPLQHCVIHANRAAALSTERRGTAGGMVDFRAVVARFGEP